MNGLNISAALLSGAHEQQESPSHLRHEAVDIATLNYLEPDANVLAYYPNPNPSILTSAIAGCVARLRSKTQTLPGLGKTILKTQVISMS